MPSPNTNRPADSFCSDHADIAVTVGLRGNAIATDVPSWILDVVLAPSAKAVVSVGDGDVEDLNREIRCAGNPAVAREQRRA